MLVLQRLDNHFHCYILAPNVLEMENVYLWSFWWLPGVIDDVVSTTVRCTVWWHVADLCFALSVDSCPITKCSNFFLKLIILLCAVPLLLAGMQPSRSGCPEPNLTWSRTLPGMGHPQFLQASFFSGSPSLP